MADLFCDHDAYKSAYNVKLGDTPTLAQWAVPQEGDGSGKYAAITSATASITLNSQAAAGNTVSICGVGFTAQVAARTAGSATFTLGADAFSTANNLAAAINDCTSSVGALVAIGVPQIRNLMYARGPTTRGDSSTLVDLMMRVGSAALNYNATTNVNVGFASTLWSIAPTYSNFAGGVGGCWGVLANAVAMGVANSYAIAQYGVMASGGGWKPFVCTLAATPTAMALPVLADNIWLRSRNGVRLTFTSTFPCLNHGYHENLILDSNTKWTEDTGNGLFELVTDCNAQAVTFNMGAYNFNKTLSCLKQYSLKILTRSVGGNSGTLAINVAPASQSPVALFNIYMGEDRDSTALGYALITPYISANSYTTASFSNCKLDLLSARTAALGGLVSGSIIGSLIFDDSVFNVNFTGTVDPGPVINCSFSGVTSVKFRNTSFLGAPATQNSAFRVMNSTANLSSSEVVFENCTGVKLDTYIGFQVARYDASMGVPYVFISLATAGKAFRHETVQGVADWNPLAATPYPLLSATLPDGTKWSMKVDWLYYHASQGQNAAVPYTAPKLAMYYRDTLAVRAITLEMFVKSTLGITAMNSSVRVAYTNSAGLVCTETTRMRAECLVASQAVWANVSGYPNHVAKKYVLTTSQAISPGTEVAVYFSLMTPSPSSVAEPIFLDPQFSIA